MFPQFENRKRIKKEIDADNKDFMLLVILANLTFIQFKICSST